MTRLAACLRPSTLGCLLLLVCAAAARAKAVGPTHEQVLVVKPTSGEPGATLVVRGGPFGPRRGGLRLVMQEQVSGSHAKPRQVELQILQWDAQEVRAQIPSLAWREGGRFAIVLVDSAKGTALARSNSTFTLAPSTGGADGTGEKDRHASRLNSGETSLDATGKPEPNPKPVPADDPSDSHDHDRARSAGDEDKSRSRLDGAEPRTGPKPLPAPHPKPLPKPDPKVSPHPHPKPLPVPDPELSKHPHPRPWPGPDPKVGPAPTPRPIPADEPRRHDDRDRPGAAGGSDPTRDRTEAEPGLDPRGFPNHPDPSAADGPLGRSPDRHPDPRGGPGPRQRGWTQRTALVLQGGGALGAFQVGALKNLYARGLEPQIITATSVGALNAAMLAEGRGVDGVADLERLWRSLRGDGSIFAPNPQFARIGDDSINAWKDWLANLAGSVLLGSPAVPITAFGGPSIEGSINEVVTDIDAIESINIQDPLRHQVERHINPRCVESSGIEVRMAAVARDGGDVRFFTETGDIETEDGRQVRRGRVDGPAVASGNGALLAPNLSDGVLASSAIPFFFKPWLTQGGEYYWDGAVRESTPVRKALEMGATNVVVVLTSPAPWSHELALAPSSYGLVIEHVLQVGNVEGVGGGAGDFRASVRINNQRDAWVTSRWREDDRNMFPRWTFFSVTGDIEIRIDDFEDSPDQCDVSPVRGRKNLQIHLEDGEISGDVQGHPGDLFTARGRGDGNEVEIQFRIVAISEGPSAYLGDSALSVTPVRRVLQAFGQMSAEMAEGDMAVLDTLDSLSEVAAEVGEDRVLRGLRSFPLPRDVAGEPYFLPRYDVVDAPMVLGEVTDFDPDFIRLNIKIGEIAAKYTRIDFLDRRGAPRMGPYLHPTQNPELSDERLEQLKRDEILGLLRDEIDDLAADPNTVHRRGILEREVERLRRARIVPSRHSPRLGPEAQDTLVVPAPHRNECIEDPCPELRQRVATLEASVERLQERLSSRGGSATKAQLLTAIEEQQRRLATAREDYRRQCREGD